MSWNQFRRDRRNSGVVRDRESPSRPAVAWTVDLEGAIADPPVLDRDTVYVGTAEGAYAYDRETGRYRWPFRTDSDASSPVLSDGVVAFSTRDGSVYGLEAGSGEQLWRASVPAPVPSPPAEHEGRVYVGHAEGVSAFAIETGERVWSHETDAATVAAPAIGDGIVYVGTRDDEVLALALESDGERASSAGSTAALDEGELEPDAMAAASDAVTTDVGDSAVEPGDEAGEGEAHEEDGDDPVWTVPVTGAIAGGPTIVPDDDGGRVYVADDGGLVLSMDAATGQAWFTYEIRDAFTSAPTIVDDALFVAADDGYLHVTDTRFGTRKVRGWLFAKKGISLDDVSVSEPALVGGTICLGDASGSVFGIDAEGLDFAWHVPLDAGVSSGPAVRADGLYVGTDDDRLIRLAWDDADRR